MGTGELIAGGQNPAVDPIQERVEMLLVPSCNRI